MNKKTKDLIVKILWICGFVAICAFVGSVVVGGLFYIDKAISGVYKNDIIARGSIGGFIGFTIVLVMRYLLEVWKVFKKHIFE